ncbi:MAG: hypothetical protein OQK98_00580 [Gammaproteobacteria bacterium]|nr:hypothetical protein [Gammaproteobacteria bacterium]
MINTIRNWLTTFLFVLFSLSCSSTPTIAISDDSPTIATPTKHQAEEEPECE